MRFSTTLVAIAGLTTSALAHKPEARQANPAPSSAPAASSASNSPAAAASSAPPISAAPAATTPNPSITLISTGPSAIPLASITESAATAVTDGLHPTLVATPGATPTAIPGAPALPNFVFTAGSFPPLDLTPDTSSPQVQAWIAEVQNSGVTIPNYAPTVDAAACASNAAAAADQSRCWWTCGECTRSTDITTCPDKLTWGVSYDDGPSDYTADLLNYMDDQKLKSTFFIVGSRAISRPNILQAEYMAGHQLSVHTWSHPPLTTLTNEQVIAELGWTREAIRQITGVSPNTMRPPYGDIDDRVRAIAMAMGMTPIIWTSNNGADFDTNDWHIPSGQSVYSVIQTFDSILDTASQLNTGIIVLAHDLYQQTVELATGYILPDALARRNPQFNLMSIIECQHKPLSDAYVETNNNQTNPFASNANPLTGSAAVSATGGGGAASGGSPTGSSSAAGATSNKTNSAVGRTVAGGVVGVVALAAGMLVL